MFCSRVSVLSIARIVSCASHFFKKKKVHWLKAFPLSLSDLSTLVTLWDFNQTTGLDPPESKGLVVQCPHTWETTSVPLW